MALPRNTDIIKIKSEIVGKDYIPFHLGNYNLLSGAGGVGKSLITLKMVAHFLMEFPDKQALCYFTEDTMEEIEKRVQIITKTTKITYDELFERTFFFTLDNDHQRVLCKKKGSDVVRTSLFQETIDDIKENNIGLLVLDPLERFHSGLAENNESDMKDLVITIQEIAVQTGIGIILLHHTTKGDKSGFRGSGVIGNKTRLVYNVRKNMVLNKETGLETVRPGWEKSVVLSTVKDNHFVARDCMIIKLKDGRLDLPT